MLMFLLKTAETVRYLNPVRDLGVYKHTIRDMIADGSTVTLVGKDLYRLMERLSDRSSFGGRTGTRRCSGFGSRLCPGTERDTAAESAGLSCRSRTKLHSCL